jgi:hypothetical protein
MKSMICRAALASLLVGLIAAVSGNAQISSDSFIFTAPFPFVVGDAILPPGDYVVRPAVEGSTVLEIAGRGNKAAALINVQPTQSPKTPEKTEVIFKKYGDDYVLSEIWRAGDNTGAVATKARYEQRYAKRGGEPTRQSVSATKA